MALLWVNYLPSLCVGSSVVHWIQQFPLPWLIPWSLWGKFFISVLRNGVWKVNIWSPWICVCSAYLIVTNLPGYKILGLKVFSLRILKFHNFRRSLIPPFPNCSWELCLPLFCEIPCPSSSCFLSSELSSMLATLPGNLVIWGLCHFLLFDWHFSGLWYE